MDQRPEHAPKARAQLIADRITPGLAKKHDQWALEYEDLIDRFGDTDPAYLMEALGPGWTTRPCVRPGITILVRNISVAAAEAQIKARAPSDNAI